MRAVEPTRSPLLSSVRNAARVLRAFSHADQEMGVTELSRRLGLGKSTTHRLVATLEAERLLEQDPATGKYRLGLALYELGTTVTEHVDLHQASLPVLTTLRHRTGEMVHVAVLDGLEAVYVERLESPYMLPVFRRVGHRLPAHWTSSGKVLLAALPRAELERRLKGAELDARTSHTITDHRALVLRAPAGRQAGLGVELRGGRAGRQLGRRPAARRRREGDRRGHRGRQQRAHPHRVAAALPGRRARGGRGDQPPARLPGSAALGDERIRVGSAKPSGPARSSEGVGLIDDVRAQECR